MGSPRRTGGVIIEDKDARVWKMENAESTGPASGGGLHDVMPADGPLLSAGHRPSSVFLTRR